MKTITLQARHFDCNAWPTYSPSKSDSSQHPTISIQVSKSTFLSFKDNQIPNSKPSDIGKMRNHAEPLIEEEENYWQESLEKYD